MASFTTEGLPRKTFPKVSLSIMNALNLTPLKTKGQYSLHDRAFSKGIYEKLHPKKILSGLFDSILTHFMPLIFFYTS